MSYTVALVMQNSMKSIAEPLLQEQIRQKQIAVNLITVDMYQKNYIEAIREFQDKIDLIICSRNIGEILMENNISCPIHPILPRLSDLLTTVQEASASSNRIEILARKHPYAGTDSVKPFVEKYGITLNETVYNRVSELEDILKEFRRRGSRTVICGTIVHDYLRTHPEFSDIDARYFFTKEGLVESINQALNSLVVFGGKPEWKELSPFLNGFDNYALLCDEQEQVLLVNDKLKRSVKMLNESAGDLYLKDLVEDYHEGMVDGETVHMEGTAYRIRLLQKIHFWKNFELILLEKEQEKTVMRLPENGGPFARIVGRSDIMQKTKYLAERFAKTDETILITGETGTGKELFAQSIHKASARKDGPFWAINCAALPEALLESELFGYEEGAFTGAVKRGKMGLFELANGGTLFLDEVGEISLSLQAKLLRVLEERQILRLGGNKMIPVDIRIVCATNRNLLSEVHEGRFRSDLFYRINVLQLFIPPLRERNGDVRELTEFFFLKQNVPEWDILEQTNWFMDIFEGYLWPGNIRELNNMCKRFTVMNKIYRTRRELAEALLTDVDALSLGQENAGDHYVVTKRQPAEEKTMTVEEAIKASGGNLTKAAGLLGISRTTLWRRLKNREKVE